MLAVSSWARRSCSSAGHTLVSNGSVDMHFFFFNAKPLPFTVSKLPSAFLSSSTKMTGLPTPLRRALLTILPMPVTYYYFAVVGTEPRSSLKHSVTELYPSLALVVKFFVKMLTIRIWEWRMVECLPDIFKAIDSVSTYSDTIPCQNKKGGKVGLDWKFKSSDHCLGWKLRWLLK